MEYQGSPFTQKKWLCMFSRMMSATRPAVITHRPDLVPDGHDAALAFIVRNF